MSFRQVYFRITSGYKYGDCWQSPQAEHAFREESRSLFTEMGWVLEQSKTSGICDTARRGQQELYLHPMNFSGVVDVKEIPRIETALAKATTFLFRNTDIYEEYLDLNDEEYWAMLETNRDKVIAAILSRYRTKRCNLYIVESQVLQIARNFTIHRLSDKEDQHNIANLFVHSLVDQLVEQGCLVTAKTRKGLGIRAATAKDKPA